jgi:dipeptidase D
VENLPDTLEPGLLWKYFFELSKIPRGSKVEAEAAKWVADQGRALGLKVEQDAAGNVLIRKPGTSGKENHPGVTLQAHVDMVCEKNEGTEHDFLKDPLKLRLDGDMLRATGTTLGADNGIGVCAGLAVLAGKEIAHGPVELLVTVDEETGLTGAKNIQANWMKSKFLINLDSEEEGNLTIGCAGGIDTITTRQFTMMAPNAGRKAFRLKIFGLKGGHSGIDINAGRGNAIRILAQVLNALRQTFAFELSVIKGGNKRNAIPREAYAYLFLDPAQEAVFTAELTKCEADWKATLGAFDPGLSMVLESGNADQVLSAGDATTLINLLLCLPHGVESMSSDIPGLVQTSTNLGIIDTRKGTVEINLLSRSAIGSSRKALTDRIAGACALAGFGAHQVGGYPGWKPSPNASIVKLIDGVQERLFGKPMKITAIHAGLECGIIGEKYPDMEMASIGPDMWDVHTPDEHVSVSSVGNFWKLLVAVLEKI